MASPDAIAFICLPQDFLSYRKGSIYADISVASALLGMAGSLYLLFVWNPHSRENHRQLPSKISPPIAPNKTILFSLALSDALACFFVILKSFALFIISRPEHSGDSLAKESYAYWGHPLATLLRYWYQCTFLWTFCFSLDVYLQVTHRNVRNALYHLVWIVAALNIAVGTVPIALEFHSTCPNETHWEMKLAYVPIWVAPLLVTAIGSPILYALAYRRIRSYLRQGNFYTDNERRFLNAFRWKFVLVIVFFYLCWWESLVRIVLYYAHTSKRLWYASAAFNPLQGLFNAFIYGRHRFFRRLATGNLATLTTYGTITQQSMDSNDDNYSSDSGWNSSVSVSGNFKEVIDDTDYDSDNNSRSI